jgi:hypothetical protein
VTQPTNNLQVSPYLKTQWQFPYDDLKSLSHQVDIAYIDIATKVNSRSVGNFAVNYPIVTGDRWYLSGSSNEQQTLRQVYPFFAITGATQANPAVLTIPGNTFAVGQSITINNVGGMTQLNGNTYTITAISGSSVTINVNSTGFGAYTSGGTAINAHGINFASITLMTQKCYGSYTDGTNWYGVIYSSSVGIAGQVTFYVTPTNIVVTVDAAAPAVTSGIIVLEWLSQF